MEAPTRGKLVALVGVIAAAALITGLGIGFRREALELWYLHRLDGAQGEEANRLAQKLGAMGSARAIPELTERYLRGGDGSPAESELRQALDRAPPGAEDGLIREIRSADPADVELLLLVLDHLDAESRWPIAVLRAGLRHEEASLRRRSADGLLARAPGCTAAIPELTRALGDSSSEVQLAAVQVLARIGAKAPGVRRALQRAAQGPVPAVRDVAARSLSSGTPPEQPAEPAP